jgi:hypothetical protein
MRKKPISIEKSRVRDDFLVRQARPSGNSSLTYFRGARRAAREFFFTAGHSGAMMLNTTVSRNDPSGSSW